MRAAQFTPGPWHFLDTGEIVPSDSYGFPNPDVRICFIATAGSAINAHERIEANANLIAAAPDLFQALNTIFDGEYLRDSLPQHVRDHVLNALAKARGDA